MTTMSIRPLTLRSILCAVGAALVLSAGVAFGAITDDATVVLANAHMRMTFTKSHKDLDTTKSAILIRSIENLTPADRAVLFDTTMSNIFSVEFRTIPFVVGKDPIKVPAELNTQEVNSIVLDGSKLTVVKTPKRAERQGRNPATGAKITIPAKPAGKKLKARFFKSIKVEVGQLPRKSKKDD